MFAAAMSRHHRHKRSRDRDDLLVPDNERSTEYGRQHHRRGQRHIDQSHPSCLPSSRSRPCTQTDDVIAAYPFANRSRAMSAKLESQSDLRLMKLLVKQQLERFRASWNGSSAARASPDAPALGIVRRSGTISLGSVSGSYGMTPCRGPDPVFAVTQVTPPP
jgi:hypothetical protein